MTTPKTGSTGPPAGLGNRFPWIPVLMLGIAGFLGVTVELSPAGLLNAIAADLDATAAEVGTLTTFFALGNALLVLPLTALALRFTRRAALVTVMLLFVVSSVAVGIAPTILTADIGRFVGGACYGVLCSLLPAVAAVIAGPKNAVKAMTVVLTTMTLGITLGAPLASLIGHQLGWRVTFLAAAAAALVIAVLLSFAVPHIRSGSAKRLPLRQATRLPGVLRVCIGWGLLMLGHFVVLTYIDAYLEHLGVPPAVTTLTLVLLGAGGVAGVLLVGWISRKSVMAALLIAPATVAVAFGVLALGGSALPVVLTAVATWGAGFSGTILVYQQTILIVGHRAPETSTSIGVLMAQAGFAIGATVGGLTVNVLGVAVLPLVAATFVLGTLIIATTLRSTLRSAQQHHNDKIQKAAHPETLAEFDETLLKDATEPEAAKVECVSPDDRLTDALGTSSHHPFRTQN